MKRDDWMLLSLTFLTGLAIGMYVYIMFFKPTYAPENLSGEEATASEWSLVARRYSDQSDRGVEPSFRLLGDRSYVYLPGGQSDEALTPREGKISARLMRELRQYDDELYGYSAPPLRPDCPSVRGGYDFEYRFVVDNTSYLLDTCSTALGHDTGLALALEAVWAEVEGTSASSFRQYDSFSDWAEDWIRRNLGTD